MHGWLYINSQHTVSIHLTWPEFLCTFPAKATRGPQESAQVRGCQESGEHKGCRSARWPLVKPGNLWGCQVDDMGPKSGPSKYEIPHCTWLTWPLDFQGFPDSRSWLNSFRNWLSRFVPPNPLTWTTSRWSNRNSPTPLWMILGVNYLWCFGNQGLRWIKTSVCNPEMLLWSSVPRVLGGHNAWCHLSLREFKAICCWMKIRKSSSATHSGRLDDFDVPHVAQLLCQVWAFHFEAVGSSQYANQHEKRRRWRCLPAEQDAEVWENRVGGVWVKLIFLVHS